jgi:hypothetical protein
MHPRIRLHGLVHRDNFAFTSIQVALDTASKQLGFIGTEKEEHSTLPSFSLGWLPVYAERDRVIPSLTMSFRVSSANS